MNMNRKRSLKLVQAAQKRSRSQSQQNINLDQLMEERKDEKRKVLKGKLQEKLETIRDRRVSGVNNEPFPEGSFELLESNNIWEEVFGYLNDAVDVTSAFYTCGKFTEFLEKRRTLMVMPKMLTTLKTSIPSENWRRICFNIRDVSKAWMEIANFQLFDAPFSKADWFYRPMMQSQYDSDWSSTSCVFKDEESVDLATSLLYSRESQVPSLSIRNVMVTLTNEGASEGFFRKVIEFLKTHGGSVWFFAFVLDWACTGNMGESYEKLCEMLESMPNLKGLELFDFDIYVRHRTVEEIQNFRERANQRPLPISDSLEHLFFMMRSDVPVLSQILGKCVNLRSVVCKLDQDITYAVIESLRGLKVERYHGPATPIISPVRVAWPLRHLAMDLEESAKASVLFPILNCFRETLKFLQIAKGGILMDTHNRNRNFRLELDLPHLEFLRLESIGRRYLGFDDLLLLKSLKELSVRDNFRDFGALNYLDEDKNAKVKVANYLGNGETDKSNVWKWFPDLMKIQMGYHNIFRP